MADLQQFVIAQRQLIIFNFGQRGNRNAGAVADLLQRPLVVLAQFAQAIGKIGLSGHFYSASILGSILFCARKRGKIFIIC
jgi:hypothetical protein